MVSESNIYINGRIFSDLTQKNKEKNYHDPEKEQQKIIFDLLYSVKESENFANSFNNGHTYEEKNSVLLRNKEISAPISPITATNFKSSLILEKNQGNARDLAKIFERGDKNKAEVAKNEEKTKKSAGENSNKLTINSYFLNEPQSGASINLKSSIKSSFKK